jgi:hypothetical protein
MTPEVGRFPVQMCAGSSYNPDVSKFVSTKALIIDFSFSAIG